ncbi:MAG: CRISPR-associated endoribonuclease Cas6, partial [Candidatus Omnitrophica bacterium]|nr:CRISPR-associated endoribonuclease Cas6 [Candidatus Omnitrophota bacterium]
MRVEISLNSQEKINLPKSYNHILQGLIYKLLDPTLRKFLHNCGYQYEKRKFKLFTFSRLIGKFKDLNTGFQFICPIKFFISSPKDEILQSLAEGFLRKEKLFLADNEVFIESISVMPKPSFSKEVIIKMLSPITIYSTLKKSDGSKKTYYYSPFEDEFNKLIRENLKKKYQVSFYEEIDGFDFNIEPYKVRPQDEKVILYKKPNSNSTVIKAWMGLYKLKGNPRLIEFSYDTGLGSKNSLGFGCWEVKT